MVPQLNPACHGGAGCEHLILAVSCVQAYSIIQCVITGLGGGALEDKKTAINGWVDEYISKQRQVCVAICSVESERDGKVISPTP